MADSILYYKFSNTDKSLTGNFSFNQAAADDQQVTLDEGLNISVTYGGKTYTQADDSLALLFTNQSGEIADQGLGLQFVIPDVFTVNADIFFDANTDQNITYTPIYSPTDLVFNTNYNFSNTDQSFTGSLSFNQAAADDQQVTLAEGLNISATYNGQSYTQADDSLALLLTNQSGEIADQGLGLQFVISDVFTVNADVFFDANSDQAITYTLAKAPTNSALSAVSVDENIASGTIINSLSTTDPDSGTFTYSLVSGTGDTDNAAFTIDGNNLKINSSANFEIKSTYNIRVRTTDNDGLFFEKPLTITVNDLNETPTDLELSATSVNENVAASTVIGSFSSIDQDQNDTFTYSLVSGTGDTDNAAFTIDSNNLKINISPNFEIKSTYNIRVRATDNDGLFFEKPLTITVNDLNEINASNQAPTDLALSATSVNENVAAQTVIGSFSSTDQDQNDTFIYSLVSGTGDTDNAAFTIDSDKLKINISPDFENKSNYKIRVRTTDKSGLFVEKALTITVNDLNIATKLTKNVNNDIFAISGDSSKAKIQVTLTGRSSKLVNELCIFNVDDAAGNINGIAPSSTEYVKAALERSQVIFSVIANSPNGFNTDNLTRLLEFNSGDNLRFFLVKEVSTDAVKRDNSLLSKVLISNTSNQKITDLGDDGFSLSWKDVNSNNTAEFNDLVVKIQPTNTSLTLGSNLQGKPQGEVIDLRDITQQVKADFVVNREAAFNNFVGFYQVVDENGGINVDGKILLPGESGYTQAAVSKRVAGIDLRVDNQATVKFSDKQLTGGGIFAPFIISNGTVEQVLSQQTNQVYFAYLGANPDQVDHIRLLGDNIFGFEDLANGGDQDFNDMVVRVNLSIA